MLLMRIALIASADDFVEIDGRAPPASARFSQAPRAVFQAFPPRGDVNGRAR
jgi:hypothetical protein